MIATVGLIVGGLLGAGVIVGWTFGCVAHAGMHDRDDTITPAGSTTGGRLVVKRD